MKRILLVGGLLSIAAASHAVSYFNDFESAVGAEWSSTGTNGFSGTNILGRFSGATVILSLSGFTVGQVVSLDFDFYALDSWDGNNNPYGPDRFAAFAGASTVVDSTFSNITNAGWEQSYPNSYGSGSYVAQTGAVDVDVAHGGSLADGYYGNSKYHFTGSTVATSSNMTFTFTDFGSLQGLGDESWGVDNVRINSVPEPATMSLAAAAALAALRKRRRNR